MRRIDPGRTPARADRAAALAELLWACRDGPDLFNAARGKALDERSRTLADGLGRAAAAGLLPRAAAVGGEGHGEVGGTPYGI